MITKHTGGELVKGGVYWSRSAGEFVSIQAEGGRLSGDANDVYYKAPLPLVLIVGPIMGLAFALFLPISGLMVLIPFLADKVRTAISPSAAHMAGARPQPGVSYLESRRDGGTAKSEPDSKVADSEQEDKLIDLAREIAEKRWRDE